MLSKLLKYEFKSTARTFGIVYLIMLVLCCVTGVADKINELVFDNSDYWILLLLITVMFLFAAVIITTVLNLNRFDKGVFGDEGYLLHTLPVHPWQIIAAKLIPAVTWTIGTVFVILCSVVLMILSSTGGFLDFFRDLIRELDHIQWEDMGTPLQWLSLLLVMLISFILQVYAARSLGHLFLRPQTGWSVGIWFLLNFVQSNLFNLAQQDSAPLLSSWSCTYSLGTIVISSDFSNDFLIQLAFYLAWAGIYWAATQWVLTKKLNLE